MKNPIAFLKTQVYNFKRSRMEKEVIVSVSSILTEALKYVVADSGLVTTTGRSKLEEQYGLEVFEEMSRDAQVKAALSVKKFAVLSGKWEVKPYDDSEASREQAEFVRWNLDRLLGDTGLGLEPVTTAFAYGRSVCEKVYKLQGTGKYKGKYVLDKLKPKNIGFIDFEMDSFNNIKKIRSLDQLGNETKVPIEKCIHYAWDTEFDNPFGRSDLSCVWQWYWAKKTIYKYFLIFCDKYASPIPVIEVEKNLTAASETALDTAAKNYHLSNFLKLPRGVKLQLHQNNGTAGAIYLAAINMCDSQITRAILAQTLSTNENQKTGTHAQAQVHERTLKYILSKVQNDMEKTIVEEQIVRQMVDMNFPNVEGYPKFCFESVNEEFLSKMAGVISTLCNVSDEKGNRVIEPTEEWIRERLGLPPRDEKEFPIATEIPEHLKPQQNNGNMEPTPKKKDNKNAKSK